jgi:SHS2 domain-containing protein
VDATIGHHRSVPDAKVGPGDRARRWHEAVDHTADVGLRAAAPDGEALFEEAAAALAELSADVGGADALHLEVIEIMTGDLEQLMFRWLNELIGLAEVRGEALVRTEVSRVERGRMGWVVRGRAWFAPFDATGVRPRVQVKAVTLHRLRVTQAPKGWALEAYLDI